MPSLAELREQYNKKQELTSKKIDIIPGDKKNQKNPDKKVPGPQPKKPDMAPRSAESDNKRIPEIDHKINELVNERILKLVSIGMKHELTMETMMQYFREVNKTKLYELGRYFSDSKLSDIDDMLQEIYKKGVLIRDKDNWYRLKSK